MTLTHYAFSSSFFMGLLGLIFYRTHLLSALLCLEAMMLTLFISLSIWALQLVSTSFMACPLILLALSACEAGAGLALLVATARSHGTDRLKNLSLLRC
uniref:NADH-ubiquinone oxidoreductase chain 4L n=1 Tax=Oryzias sarasinorum TaxID=1231042 RepID=B5BQ25_9TELE|nr:NADH dehydrogenase subunit 4L [Oryzias sarasinorum]BAG69202.1 NADH dehydrogenase subunit 4L [Oryzias sarasinorum]